MSRFITGSELNHEIEKLIKEAVSSLGFYFTIYKIT